MELNNNLSELEELLAAYALGALDDDERAQVEAKLAKNSQARRQLDEMLETTAFLAYAAEQRSPSAGLRSRILNAAQTTPQMQRASTPVPVQQPSIRSSAAVTERHGSFWSELVNTFFGRMALASSMAAAVLLIFGGVLYSQLVAQQAQIAALQQAAERQQQIVALLGDPANVQRTLQASTGSAGSGAFYFKPDSSEVLVVVQGMRPLPADQAYQLWVIQGNAAPVPLPTFTVDGTGRAYAVVRAPQKITQYDLVAITPEPRTGSPAPTNQPVMVGKIS